MATARRSGRTSRCPLRERRQACRRNRTRADIFQSGCFSFEFSGRPRNLLPRKGRGQASRSSRSAARFFPRGVSQWGSKAWDLVSSSSVRSQYQYFAIAETRLSQKQRADWQGKFRAAKFESFPNAPCPGRIDSDNGKGEGGE
eukprot:9158568-Pyramimonas_sp.AAC.1